MKNTFLILLGAVALIGCSKEDNNSTASSGSGSGYNSRNVSREAAGADKTPSRVEPTVSSRSANEVATNDTNHAIIPSSQNSGANDSLKPSTPSTGTEAR